MMLRYFSLMEICANEPLVQGLSLCQSIRERRFVP